MNDELRLYIIGLDFLIDGQFDALSFSPSSLNAIPLLLVWDMAAVEPPIKCALSDTKPFRERHLFVARQIHNFLNDCRYIIWHGLTVASIFMRFPIKGVDNLSVNA